MVFKDSEFYRQFKRDIGLTEFPPRQDYALFLRFEAIGSKDGFLQALNGDNIPIKGILSEIYSLRMEDFEVFKFFHVFRLVILKGTCICVVGTCTCTLENWC